MQIRPSRLPLAIALLLAALATLAAPGRYWEKFPSPRGMWGVGSIGVDADDGLWALCSGVLHCWDETGRKWVQRGPESSDSREDEDGDVYGRTEATLFSAGPRLYFLYRKTRKTGDSPVAIYELRNGRRRFVTAADVESPSPMSMWICRDGRVLSWEGSRLTVWAEGTRREWNVELRPFGFVMLDTGEAVRIYANRKLYTLGDTNELVTTDVSGDVKRGVSEGVLWGKDRAILFQSKGLGVRALDLKTAQAVEMTAINQTLGRQCIYDAFAVRSGAVWLLTREHSAKTLACFELSAEGELRILPETTGLFFPTGSLRMLRTPVRADATGTVWITDPRGGTARWKHGVMQRFDPQGDVAPGNGDAIVISQQGVVYVRTTTGRVYAYNQGMSLTGASPRKPIEFRALGPAVWSHLPEDKKWFEFPRRIRDSILTYTDRKGGQRDVSLVGLDPTTGKERFAVPWDENHRIPRISTPRFGVGHGMHELVMAKGDHIRVIDDRTGKTLREIALPGAGHGAGDGASELKWRSVVPGGQEDYVVGGGAPGTICRIDANGRELWRRILSPQYSASVRRVDGAGDIVAKYCLKRGREENDERLVGLGMASGNVRWTIAAPWRDLPLPTTTTRERDILELSHGSTSGDGRCALLCRDPQTGRQRWTFQSADGALCGVQIDPRTNQCFASFASSTVVCLDLATGKPKWETRLRMVPKTLDLTQSPAPPPNVVLVTGENCTLGVLDRDTGDPLAYFRLGDVPGHGQPGGALQDALLGHVWLFGDTLVVARTTGISGYRFPPEVYRPPQEAPHVSWTTPPPLGTETRELSIPLTVSGGAGSVKVWYRLNGDDWQELPGTPPNYTIGLQGLEDGHRALFVCALDAAGRSSNELTHRMAVRIDYGKTVMALITRLGSGGAAERREAKRELLALGPAVVPQLEAYRNSPDPEVRHYVQEILKALATPPKK